MIFKSPAMKLSLGLVLLTMNLLFLANLMGIMPVNSKAPLELRKRLSESLALQFSAAANRGEYQSIQDTLRAVVERNADMRSAAIRTKDGQMIALVGEHLANWRTPVEGKSTPTHVLVPVYREGRKWATMEIRYEQLLTDRFAGGVSNNFISFLLFISLSGFLCYFFVLKRALRELDPSAVIPERVQKAFDVLQEGVLILDEKEQIVMANKSFAKILDKEPAKLIGLKGSELGWKECHNPSQVKRLPWVHILREGQEQRSDSLTLVNNLGSPCKLSVTAAVVTDHAGKCRGSLVTFDDITFLEEKHFELSQLVEQLQESKEEIQSKSKELEFLANHDPLTLCLNRRSLDRALETLFSKAKVNELELSCLMIDIDYFKLVNDRYGHATGDQVIQAVANVLRDCTRDSDLVSRYGGEEFCIVLPGLRQKDAKQIAERVRETIEKTEFGGVKITASLGLSSLEQNASKPEELINQADKALYAAKNGGRNRVILWGKSESFDVFDVVNDQDRGTHHFAEKNDSNELVANIGQLEDRVKELEGLLKKRTLEIEHYEMFDSQTGLPTRSLFNDRITHEIARSKRNDSLAVVLSVGINTITKVYATLGQSLSEQLVKACVNRLNEALRDGIDTIAVVQISEKSSLSLINPAEFGILLTDIKQVDHVTWVIKRLQDAFTKPFQIKDQKIYASTYIGVSIYPHDGQTAEELYNSAVRASSHAQQKRDKTRYQFASQKINAMATKQLQIESSLHTAIDNNEFELYFQPLVEVATGRISSFEALLRFQNKHLGSVSPDEFIEIAELSGQIERIGDWVMHQSCKQLRTWLDNGLEIDSISVNLSGLQLQQENLTKRIQKILGKYDIQPHQLELELTESTLVNSSDKTVDVLKQIKKLGIQLTIDDFGTGYSSLAYLRTIPLSCVKIDRSFIRDIGIGIKADKLIASIISMARTMGLVVVAEGVEHQHQAKALTDLGCERLQGYLFGHPLPADEIPAFLNSEDSALSVFRDQQNRGDAKRQIMHDE